MQTFVDDYVSNLDMLGSSMPSTMSSDGEDDFPILHDNTVSYKFARYSLNNDLDKAKRLQYQKLLYHLVNEPLETIPCTTGMLAGRFFPFPSVG